MTTTNSYRRLLCWKLYCLEVNVEVNGLCDNNTTLSLSHDSRQIPASMQLVRTDTAPKKQEETGLVQDNKSLIDGLGAKPKIKSSWANDGRLTDRAQHPDIWDTNGWPVLESRPCPPTAPIFKRMQSWTVAKGRTKKSPTH